MTDAYNGEWTIPAHTAMCLWEEVITADQGTYPFFERYRDGHGANATRELIISLVEKCDEAWIMAAAHGYDYSFDWDFVPMFLTLWCAKQDATGEELGRAILDGWKYAQKRFNGESK